MGGADSQLIGSERFEGLPQVLVIGKCQPREVGRAVRVDEIASEHPVGAAVSEARQILALALVVVAPVSDVDDSFLSCLAVLETAARGDRLDLVESIRLAQYLEGADDNAASRRVGNAALVDRTPIGRLVTMAEVVGASRFLLENQAINGINLSVDGGWMCM